MKVTIRHVVMQHRVVDAIVTTDDGRQHRIGHTPSESWHCCQHGPRCKAIESVRSVVLPMEVRA